MLIEREGKSANALRELLQALGHEVFHAEDARAGLQAALKSRPHVALVDLGLAQADGYEIVRALRSRTGEIGGALKLVALADQADQPGTDAFNQHLVRPVGPEAMRSILAEEVR